MAPHAALVYYVRRGYTCQKAISIPLRDSGFRVCIFVLEEISMVDR